MPLRREIRGNDLRSRAPIASVGLPARNLVMRDSASVCTFPWLDRSGARPGRIDAKRCEGSNPPPQRRAIRRGAD